MRSNAPQPCENGAGKGAAHLRHQRQWMLALMGVNAILLLAFAYGWQQRSARLNHAPGERSPAANNAPGPQTDPDRPSPTWVWGVTGNQNLITYKAQLAAYIATLRAARCPEETIRDIILAEVGRYFERRAAHLPMSPEQIQLWTRFGAPDADVRAARQAWDQLFSAKRRLLRELLGVDLTAELASLYPSRGYERFAAAFAKLPATKREEVQAVQETYWADLQALEERTQGFWEPEDFAEQSRVRHQRITALEQILTREELDQFHLDTSRTALALRAQLTAFAPTDAEFKALFEVRQQYEEAWSALNETDRSTREQRAELARAMAEQIKAALGEVRYADYRRAQDWIYQNLLRIARQHQLSKDTALEAYQLHRAAQDQARQLTPQPQPASEQHDQRLAKLQADTDQALSALLGQDAFQAFRRFGGGRLSPGTRSHPAALTENETEAIP